MSTLVERALAGERVPVAALGGRELHFEIDEEIDDAITDAVRHLIEAPLELFAKTTVYIVQYCRDWRPDIDLTRRMDVWKYVDLHDPISVSRQDDGIYFSIEGNCDWEEEHGLQLVFRDGREITKVGQYDGDLKTASGDVYDNGVD